MFKQLAAYRELDSTNDEAKRLVKQGASEGAVIIAELQSKGRGKPGFGWFSPPGVGVYLSAIVKPFKNPNDLGPITLVGAEAVVETVAKVTKVANVAKVTKIKMPNDVLLNGKKICGILVERVASGHVIIGIGVNLNNPAGSFPEELKDTATSLKIETGRDFDRQEFIDGLLVELDQAYLAYLNKI
ncbi:biotin--[acetyl-CoA-carboxylase] ligase [Candidatus Margulisiibacteriota bacterium]